MDWETFSQADLEGLCQPRIFQRGQAYYHEGHLVKACRFENVLAGKFRGGGGIYQTVLRLEAGKPVWECSCPYPDFCKHLAALGYAWLNNRSLFEELDTLYRQVMEDVGRREQITHDLVAKSPFNFLDLCQRQSDCEFASNRVVLNIIRGLFKYPQHRLADVESLWERLQGIIPLMEAEIERGEAEILTPLKEVWEPLLTAYRSSPIPGLKELLLQQLELQRSLLRYFPKEQLQSFFDGLIASYFDVLLWELGEEIRPVLQEYLEVNPSWQSSVWEAVNGRDGYLHWIRCYELLEAIPALKGQLPTITERLRLTREGQLWLIDHWMAEGREEAYRLAKTGLAKSNSGERGPYRERLIAIHRLRSEFKQAAALSYIQLLETLEFEEYLRLKVLLAGYPDEFHSYYRRLVNELWQRRVWGLLARIMFDAGRYQEFTVIIPEALAETEAIFGLLEVLADCKDPAIIEYPIYPPILLAALKGSPRHHGRQVFRAIAAYKKLCLQNKGRDIWEAFVSEAKSSLDQETFGRRRLGALLD